MKFAAVQSRDLLHLDFECAHLVRGQVNNPKSLGCATRRPAGIPEPASMGDGTAGFVVSHPFAKCAKGWGTQPEYLSRRAWETERRGSWSPTLSPSARKDGAPSSSASRPGPPGCRSSIMAENRVDRELRVRGRCLPHAAEPELARACRTGTAAPRIES